MSFPSERNSAAVMMCARLLTELVPNSGGLSRVRRLADPGGVAAADAEAVGFALGEIKQREARRFDRDLRVHPLPAVCAGHTLTNKVTRHVTALFTGCVSQCGTINGHTGQTYLFYIVHDTLKAFPCRWLPAQHHVVLGGFCHLKLERSARNDALWWSKVKDEVIHDATSY